MQLKSPLLLGAASSFLAASSYLVFGGTTVNETVNCPAHISAKVTADGCTNNPGPYIKLEGEVFVAGIDAVMIFRNNLKGTHEHEEEVKVKVSLSTDKAIKFAKQPPLGGVGGNPWFFLKFFDHKWRPLSDKMLLGRCVQGLKPVSMGLKHAAAIFAEIAGSCSNKNGPYITLGGDMTFGGLNAKLYMQNSPHDTAPHKQDEKVVLKIEIVSPDGVIKFAKQPPLDGVGGNPHCWVQFECKGEKLSDEIYLGRCVQLSKS